MYVRITFFCKKFANSKIMCIFAADLGEKSWIHDALAYYFALYRRSLENKFGIVRFKKQREKANGWLILSTRISYVPRFGVAAFLYC